MPKVGMEPIRRAEAINAALECFCVYGTEKTTLEMVAEKAGFSKGIVSYYFSTKRQLILESFKAFLSAYKLKITGSLTNEMKPDEMIKSIMEVSLPPIEKSSTQAINVSSLEGNRSISLPEYKIAKLFVILIANSANDDELKSIMIETYKNDTEGISSLIKYTKGGRSSDSDDIKAAYSMLAMVYGLSFFRVIGFMPNGEDDNRSIAMEFVSSILD